MMAWRASEDGIQEDIRYSLPCTDLVLFPPSRVQSDVKPHFTFDIETRPVTLGSNAPDLLTWYRSFHVTVGWQS